MACGGENILNKHSDTSLVVQWGRLHASTAGGSGSTRSLGTSSHMLHGTGKKKQLIFPSFSVKQKINLPYEPCEGILPIVGGRNASLLPEIENPGPRSLYKEISVLSLTSPSPPSLWILHQSKPKA